MKETNYSLSGEQTQQMKWPYKVGVTLFILGLLLLWNAYSYHFFLKEKLGTIIAFGSMLLGSFLFTYDPKHGFHLLSHYSRQSRATQLVALFLGAGGLSILLLSWIGIHFTPAKLWLGVSLGAMALSILLYTYGSYLGHPKGIKNNYNMFNSLTSRGLLGWTAGIVLTLFYIHLYWDSSRLEGMIRLFDPLAQLLTGKQADQWFVYGSLYTFIIFFLGIKFMVKYRHNRYQLVRTVVVIFSQVVLAYFLPQIMEGLNYNNSSNAAGEYLGYYSGNPINSWPLNYDFFKPGTLKAYAQEAYQPVGMAYLFWGILLFLIVTPVVTYLVGKRWYCSWFCGCGGLAETAGDSFRHLSSKSTLSWKIERWVIHSVMVFILIMTIAVLWPFISKSEYVIGMFVVNKDLFFILASVVLLGLGFLFYRWYAKGGKKNNILLAGVVIVAIIVVLLTIAYFTGGKNVFMIKSTTLKKSYGFFVGAAFSGVIGVGFYPVLGNRVWCRFGCPMAGYMGIFQRFKSRFRITTNGGQCISCGNCSTYCEQGIDVRAYAQRGQNIVRASCVGCGICSAVCPRGVLKLENGEEEDRIREESSLIGLLQDGELDRKL
ncbi:MAG: 4Fe-4S binding protein [Bacteroidetes bacterium]|nr:MAG: 4Fe-4S binding protein [Bacteroidota bacterium]